MATYQDLPSELLVEVLRYVPRHDIRSARLVNRKTHNIATPLLFATLYFSLTPPSWEHIKAISRQKELCQHVRVLRVDAKQLPEFRIQAVWEEHIDIRPFAGKYYERRARETGERIFTVKGSKQSVQHTFELAYEKLQKKPWNADAEYANYQRLVAAQKVVVDDVMAKFADYVASFTRLTRIDGEIGKSFYDEPLATGEREDLQFDKYRDWCKTKQHLFRKESWRCGHFQERMLLLRDSIATNYIIIPLFTAAKTGDHFWQLQEARFSMILHRHTDSGRPLLNFLRTQPDLVRLRTLHLQVINGQLGRRSEAEGNETLCSLLSKLTFLQELRLSWIRGPPTITGKDNLSFIQAAHMPLLQHLSLSYASTTMGRLQTFLRSHSRTLQSLELSNVTIWESTWAAMLYSLPSILKLQAFRADNLLSVFQETRLNSKMIPVTRWILQLCLLERSSTYKALWDYVLHGGSWPGVADERDYLERELEANMSEQLGWN